MEENKSNNEFVKKLQASFEKIQDAFVAFFSNEEKETCSKEEKDIRYESERCEKFMLEDVITWSQRNRPPRAAAIIIVDLSEKIKSSRYPKVFGIAFITLKNEILMNKETLFKFVHCKEVDEDLVELFGSNKAVILK